MSDGTPDFTGALELDRDESNPYARDFQKERLTRDEIEQIAFAFFEHRQTNPSYSVTSAVMDLASRFRMPIGIIRSVVEDIEAPSDEHDIDLSYCPGLEQGQRMLLLLCNTFPTLRRKVAHWPDWNPMRLKLEMGPWSEAERDCARFVLAVWNYSEFGKKFNVMDALGRWDLGNRRAFLRWAQNPWWA